MARKKMIFFLACLFVFLEIAFAVECPSQEDVAPCTCVYERSHAVIKCHGIDKEELVRVANNLRGREVETFVIEFSKLNFIPHDVFKDVKLSQLRIENSTLVTLTDGGEAFVGVEDHLREFFLLRCNVTQEWDWSVLRNLKKLVQLSIWKSLHLKTIGTDLMKASVSSTVQYVFFAENNISFVSDQAFDSFKNMRYLSLGNNQIKNVKRSMFPNPAWELEWFQLSNNKIEEFPDDMFTNMPKLRNLYIEGNKIIVLNEKTFSPVWEQLDSLYIQGNELRCDCRMSWLLEKRYPDTLLGKCASPPELKGKKLFKLNSKDFVCYV